MTATEGRQWTLKEVIDDLSSRMDKQEKSGHPTPEYFALKEVKEHWENILNKPTCS